MIKLINGDCLEMMKGLESNSVDAIITDPPYELGFMGKSWDSTGIANNVEMWKEALRVLKPGGHLLAFSGTRTYHRMAVAIEDGGFEIRDMIEWVYGSGFPKSLNIGKAVDKVNDRFYDKGFQDYCNECRTSKKYTHSDVNRLMGTALTGGGFSSSIMGDKEFNELPTVEMYNKLKPILEMDSRYDELIERTEREREVVGKGEAGFLEKNDVFELDNKGYGKFDLTKGTSEWEGWGTALKPAHEPICMARKPLSEKTVAENVLKYGTGGINIDISRVETTDNTAGKTSMTALGQNSGWNNHENKQVIAGGHEMGRFPANLIHDNSEEVRECFPETKGEKPHKKSLATSNVYTGNSFFNSKTMGDEKIAGYVDSGNASRFFKSIPAHEPICMARKPLAEKTVAENVLKYGTGGINIDESRVEYQNEQDSNATLRANTPNSGRYKQTGGVNIVLPAMEENYDPSKGRFPANLIHDNSEEVRECFPETKSGKAVVGTGKGYAENASGIASTGIIASCFADSGNASRFFKSIIYQAKASKSERNKGCEGLEKGCSHPTVKPIALMEYLINMVTPNDGTVLDPFMGSGTTGVACVNTNRDFIGIEMDDKYFEIAKKRIEGAQEQMTLRFL